MALCMQPATRPSSRVRAAAVTQSGKLLLSAELLGNRLQANAPIVRMTTCTIGWKTASLPKLESLLERRGLALTSTRSAAAAVPGAVAAAAEVDARLVVADSLVVEISPLRSLS